MYKIGITGSIGTGKTSIANIFAFFNIPIFDADKEIKRILGTEKIRKKLKKIWPNIIINDNIDKLKLRSIIFSDRKEKIKLEKLLYPYLQVEKNKFEYINCTKEVLIYDVPLIYETRSEKNYDLILLANCDPSIQKKRVIFRDKISETLYEKIIRSQLSFNEKIKFKPKVINTNNLKLFIIIRIILLLVKILIRLKLEKWMKRES